MKDKAPRFSAEQIAKQEQLVATLRTRAIEGLNKYGTDRVFPLFGNEIIETAELFNLGFPYEIRELVGTMHLSIQAKPFRNFNVRSLERMAPKLNAFAIAAVAQLKEDMSEENRQMINYRNN